MPRNLILLTCLSLFMSCGSRQTPSAGPAAAKPASIPRERARQKGAVTFDFAIKTPGGQSYVCIDCTLTNTSADTVWFLSCPGLDMQYGLHYDTSRFHMVTIRYSWSPPQLYPVKNSIAPNHKEVFWAIFDSNQKPGSILLGFDFHQVPADFNIDKKHPPIIFDSNAVANTILWAPVKR